MTTKTDATQGAIEPPAGIGFFEKWLSVWVALCILTGLVLGNLFPGVFEVLASWQYASVNLVVAVLIWAMVYPMMVAVDFASLSHIGDKPKGLILTLVVNWLIKPFTMAALGVLFFEYLFADLIAPRGRAAIYRRIDFVGRGAVYGDGFCMVSTDPRQCDLHAGAGLSERCDHGVCLRAHRRGAAWRHGFYRAVGNAFIVCRALHCAAADRGCADAAFKDSAVAAFTARVKPASVLGLLATVVLLFGFQGQVILEKPLVIALISAPLLIQSYGIFALAYAAAWAWRVPFNIAAPCALIGTSNFFELAVAVAISLFGLQSGAALATVVGVLVEVPVMLSLVAFANRTQQHFK